MPGQRLWHPTIKTAASVHELHRHNIELAACAQQGSFVAWAALLNGVSQAVNVVATVNALYTCVSIPGAAQLMQIPKQFEFVRSCYNAGARGGPDEAIIVDELQTLR